jgi:CRISPR-associated endonuclease Cas3-HD
MKASIEEIFANPDYSKIFEKEYLDKIIARPKSEDGENSAELLTAHSQVTLKIFDRVVGELELEKIFANLLEQVFGKKDKKFWHILRSIVYFHDFGKMNDAFQDRMKEIEETGYAQKTRDSDHSLPGLFLFGLLLETYLKDEDDKTKATAFYLASEIED